MCFAPDIFPIFSCYNPRELLSLWGLVFLYSFTPLLLSLVPED